MTGIFFCLKLECFVSGFNDRWRPNILCIMLTLTFGFYNLIVDTCFQIITVLSIVFTALQVIWTSFTRTLVIEKQIKLLFTKWDRKHDMKTHLYSLILLKLSNITGQITMHDVLPHYFLSFNGWRKVRLFIISNIKPDSLRLLKPDIYICYVKLKRVGFL